MPAAWRRLSEFPLRPGQEETAAALATGRDVLTRQPTGSGKTLVPMLKAAADWAAGVRRHRAELAAGVPEPRLPPVVLCVYPFRALAQDQEREWQAFFERVHREGLVDELPVAVFVDRHHDPDGGGGGGGEGSSGEDGGDGGGRGGRGDGGDGGDDGGVADGADGSSGRSGGAESAGGAKATAAEPASWEKTCCRFVWAEDEERWCKWCRKPSNARTSRVSGCDERKRRLNGGGGSSSAVQSAVVALVRAATTRAAGIATAAAAEAARLAACTGGQQPGGAAQSPSERSAVRPRRLAVGDLRANAPERRLVEDASLCALMVTPEALAAESERAQLLRRCLEASGRAEFMLIDECHCVLGLAEASYRAAC